MRSLLKFSLFLFYCCLITLAGFSQNGLIQEKNFPGTSRRSSTGFSTNKFGFLFGGFDGTCKNDFWRYNSDSDQWSQMNNFPGLVRFGAICTSVGTKVYYGLGMTNGAIMLSDFWEYDSDSDLWHQKQNFPVSGRIESVAFSIKNKIYIGTGTNGGIYYSDFWEYRPDSNTWNKKANFPGLKRCKAVGFSVNNKGYIGAGFNGTYPYYNDFWEYNPDSNTWTQKSYIGDKGIAGAVSFIIDSTPYIALGTAEDYNIKSYNHHLFSYNSINDTWNVITEFDKINRECAVSFTIGNKAYFGTGDDPITHYYNDWWEFDPSLVSVSVPEVIRYKNEFKIVPNPNQGKFIIEMDRDDINVLEAEIMNQLGEVVWKNKLSTTKGKNEIDLQTVELNQGIYFIKISGSNYFKVERFLIK